MLVYNNLLLNQNNPPYKPFLFNLVSFRRKILSDESYKMIQSMHRKGRYDLFSETEKQLFHQLINEKQFITDEQRHLMEKVIYNHYTNTPNPVFKEYVSSFQITQDCNMECAFCFENSYKNKSLYMTTEQIDSIKQFYKELFHRTGQKRDITSYRITGGEPLINKNSVDIIRYIISKWPNAEVNLFTNGVNIVKFYDFIPWEKMADVRISLDGIEPVHASRRYPRAGTNNNIYEKIIDGVDKLLSDGIKVIINTVLDKENYEGYPTLIDFFKQKDYFKNPNFSCRHGGILDHFTPLSMDRNLCGSEDIEKIENMLVDKMNFYAGFLLPSLSTLNRAVLREVNTPPEIKIYRCDHQAGNNLYFAPNGEVFFCDYFDNKQKRVGTFFPEISIHYDVIENLSKRHIFSLHECKNCPYKFVCLGGCPLSADIKGSKIDCGAFKDEKILDTLSYSHPMFL